MSRGDVSRRLVDLAEELVGRFRGGLGYVNVLASTFFAGITGSALSDIAAVGPIEIRMMEEPDMTPTSAPRVRRPLCRVR